MLLYVSLDVGYELPFGVGLTGGRVGGYGCLLYPVGVAVLPAQQGAVVQDGGDGSTQHAHAERFHNVLVGSPLQSLDDVLLAVEGGKQDDGDVRCLDVALQPCAEFVASQFWHHDVRYEQVG